MYKFLSIYIIESFFQSIVYSCHRSETIIIIWDIWQQEIMLITVVRSFTSTIIEVKRVREVVSKVKRVEKKDDSKFIIAENSEETDDRDYIKSENISFCTLWFYGS